MKCHTDVPCETIGCRIRLIEGVLLSKERRVTAHKNVTGCLEREMTRSNSEILGEVDTRDRLPKYSPEGPSHTWFSTVRSLTLSNCLLDNPFFLPALALFAVLVVQPAMSQPVIKAGLVVSGMKPSHVDARGEKGDDFRPFLGYEVDWIQHGYSAPDVGFQVGISYLVDLSSAFRVQPELFFSRRGHHFYQTALYNTAYSIIVYYLETPVLLGWRLPVDWSAQPLILAGPYAAWKLRGIRVLNISGEEETRILSNVKSLDYGIVFAVSVEFPAWSEWISAEVRSSWGLSSIMARPPEYTALYDDPGSVRNLAFALIVGYQL